MGDNKKCWDRKLRYVVWEDRIMIKESTEKIPFELVYVLDATFPINLRFPIYRVIHQNTDDPDVYQRRINSLIELDENRRKTFDHLIEHQENIKEQFDKKTLQRQLQI